MSIHKRKFSLIYTAKNTVPFRKDRLLQVMLLIYVIVFAVLSVQPANVFEWWYENLVPLAVLVILAILYRKIRLNNSSYLCILTVLFLHALGAHYTYSNCPVGDWMRVVCGFKRNNYDRLVNFAFGFLISIPVIEIIYRRLKIKYIHACILSVAIILSACALYKLFEMFSGMVLNTQEADMLLGSQRDVWDAQKDMLMGLLGALMTMSCCILFRIKKNHKIHMVRYHNS